MGQSERSAPDGPAARFGLDGQDQEHEARKAELERAYERALAAFAATREAFDALQRAHQEQRFPGVEVNTFQGRADELRELAGRPQDIALTQHKQRQARLRALGAESASPGANGRARPTGEVS